jgi:hypothetical protein
LLHNYILKKDALSAGLNNKIYTEIRYDEFPE